MEILTNQEQKIILIWFVDYCFFDIFERKSPQRFLKDKPTPV